MGGWRSERQINHRPHNDGRQNGDLCGWSARVGGHREQSPHLCWSCWRNRKGELQREFFRPFAYVPNLLLQLPEWLLYIGERREWGGPHCPRLQRGYYNLLALLVKRCKYWRTRCCRPQQNQAQLFRVSQRRPLLAEKYKYWLVQKYKYWRRRCCRPQQNQAQLFWVSQRRPLLEAPRYIYIYICIYI